jgi:uncharacterized protein (TIGR02246 family)
MPIENPEDTHRVFADAANAGDVEALIDLYDPDGVIVERNGELTVGGDAIRRHIEALIALRPEMRIVDSRAARSGETALLCSHWEAVATTPDGHQVQMEHRGSEVLRRQPDGTWRLLIDNPWGIDLAGG